MQNKRAGIEVENTDWVMEGRQGNWKEESGEWTGVNSCPGDLSEISHLGLLVVANNLSAQILTTSFLYINTAY